MLATGHLRVRHLRLRLGSRSPGMEDFQNELRALSRLGIRGDPCAVRLHDLIYKGQPESGASLELRLKRLKNLIDHRRRDSRPGVTHSDAPVVAVRAD